MVACHEKALFVKQNQRTAINRTLMVESSWRTVLLVGAMVQLPRTPDLDVQRAAMRKLDFLVGRWAGEARLLRRPGEAAVLAQTEEARYKLAGLILEIEGIGRSKSDNRPVLQALGFISFDDESGTYHMRAFNDGRFLETDVKLLEDGKSLTWGFTFGQIRTNSVLRINQKGEWTELAEITIDSEPARQLLELTVKRLE
jgi:hypothetical protein